jgi:hypothetical protein
LLTSGCLAPESQVVARQTVAALPTLLDDGQLDVVTAGAGSVTLDLSASAQGAGSISSTGGSIQTARSTILRVAFESGLRARLVRVDPVDYVLAAGRASAMGTSHAECSATLVTAIDLVFIMRVGAATVTTTSATCACAAFAIAPVGP